MNFSGGKNRTHGTVEQVYRLDSFATVDMDGGVLFSYSDGKTKLLDCNHFKEYGTETEQEIVELWAGKWSQNLELTRIPSGFGGSRAFWLCPHCGRRARFLYFVGAGFVCRECGKLNYAVQQRTKDSTNYAYDGLRLAREKLHWEPPFTVVPADFPYVTPDRPKGMWRSTYYRHLARYRRYQEKYRRDSMREMLAILHW